MAGELLAAYLKDWGGTDPQRRDVAATVEILAETCRAISVLVAQGNLDQNLGAAVTENVQGETQKALDDLTDRMLIEACRRAPVAAVASEEDEHPVPGNPRRRPACWSPSTRSTARPTSTSTCRSGPSSRSCR